MNTELIEKVFKNRLVFTKGDGKYLQRYKITALDVDAGKMAVTRVIPTKENEAFTIIAGLALSIQYKGEIRDLVNELYLKLREARPDHEYEQLETYWVSLSWFDNHNVSVPDSQYNQLQLSKEK